MVVDMSLDMKGHIDAVFVSVAAVRTSYTDGSYVDGRYVDGTTTPSNHSVTLQPVSTKDIQSLDLGGERIVDARKIYVNDGDLYSISKADVWSLTGVDGTFKTVGLDNRPWRNYCKAILSRIDE